MKFQYKHRYIVSVIIAVCILSIFFFASFIEYSRAVAEQKRELQNHIQIVSAEVNKSVHQSISIAEGSIAYLLMKPDLDQDDFVEYSSKILEEDNRIISHFAALIDTTITFVYPYEGNEGAIGVDLSLIDGQKEDVLRVKEEKINVFVGPVDLVQGGRALIHRSPILKQNDEYWGQMSLVIRYEEMLEAAGVYEFSKEHFISIEQDELMGMDQSVIYTNYEKFSEDAIVMSIEVPSGQWLIKTEYKSGFKGGTFVFYILMLFGIIFSIVIGYAVNLVLKTNEGLNKIVELRTNDISKTNRELEESLEQLKTTQDQLIMREKHAALGELVAGVAHEINTPLGVCVTVNSYIDTLTATSTNHLKEGTLKKSELEATFDKINESSLILHENLDRASKLVLSFKKLATDQFLEEHRKIKLKEYMEYVLNTISPTFKNTQHEINLYIDDTLELLTYPGAIFQIFANLIMNSLIHGFEGDEKGHINIYAKERAGMMIMDYRDTGKGISPELRDKIFDPFFTTKRNEGSTGLGMHIVYNIVYQKLNGTIEQFESEEPEGVGVHFRITLPLI